MANRYKTSDFTRLLDKLKNYEMEVSRFFYLLGLAKDKLEARLRKTRQADKRKKLMEELKLLWDTRAEAKEWIRSEIEKHRLFVKELVRNSNFKRVEVEPNPNSHRQWLVSSGSSEYRNLVEELRVNIKTMCYDSAMANYRDLKRLKYPIPHNLETFMQLKFFTENPSRADKRLLKELSKRLH